jgi:ABC-type uncharacterized transport system permease subunit
MARIAFAGAYLFSAMSCRQPNEQQLSTSTYNKLSNEIPFVVLVMEIE